MRSGNQLRPSGGLIAWFADNHVAANILMLLLVVGGVVSAVSMRRETFPSVDPRVVSVTVVYPGATSHEVADSITKRVEEALVGIEGVKRVTSTAAEGLGTTSVEIQDFADETQVYNDVETAVNGLTAFPPEDAERPTVSRLRVTPEVMTIVLHGDVTEATLRYWADAIEDELQELNGVSLTSIRGVRDYEISIEVSEDKLREYGISLQEVGDIVRDFSTDIPAGNIESQGGEVLLRIQERRYVQRDFESIAVRTLEDGSVLRLGDLATIVDAFEDSNLISRFNGKRAAFIDIQRSDAQDTLRVANEVKAYLDQLSLPSGLNLEIASDQTIFLQDRISLMVRNAVLGFMLVFLILVVFLDLKLAVWTSAAIPISFLGGLMIINFMGYSINMISLFALIVVLGIVVDDGIVTGEAIFREQEKSKGDKKAVLRGVFSVIAPVTIGVTTTMCAFAPLYFSTGTMGQIVGVIPAVVIPILFVSLIEAYFILPSHLSNPTRWSVGVLSSIRAWTSSNLESFVKRAVVPSASFCMRWRYATLGAFVAIGIATVGLVQGGFVRFIFFPQVESDTIQISVAMPIGTPFSTTEETVAKMEGAIEEVRDLIDEGESELSIIASVASSIGNQRGFQNPDGGGNSDSGGHLGEISIQLIPSDFREFAASEIVSMIRERVEKLPGIDELTFQSSFVGADADIEFELFHANDDLLQEAAAALRDEMGAIEGAFNITSSSEEGKTEYLYRLNAEGLALGLTPQELGSQLRSAYFGLEIDRVQRGPSEVIVYVRYPKKDRELLSTLASTRIRLRDGREVPLSSIADRNAQIGQSKIESVDGRQIVRLTADADSKVTTPNEVIARLEADVLPKLQSAFPGLSYAFAGETKEQAEDLQSLLRNMMIALLLIFVLLGGQLRSYFQPFVIMGAIPFGVFGAILGHFVLGYDLSFISMFGVVALTGVVVNDSVVMLDYMNRRLRDGVSLTEAAKLAVARRFRPILLTTLSTCLGLLPMLTETSVQAKFLIPMVVSLAMGILLASPVILVLVPCLLMVLDDVQRVLRRARDFMVRGDFPTQGLAE